MTIECEDGKAISETVEQPLGEPSNPLSDSELIRKARISASQ